MMSSVCSSIGSRLRQIPAMFRYSSSQANDEGTAIPYAKAFGTSPADDETKNEDCAICMGKLRYMPLILQKD